MRCLTAVFFSLFLLACNFAKIEKESELNLVVAASLIPTTAQLTQHIETSLGVKLRVHSGASSMLARQIVNGLPCDVVILADTEWMEFLQKKNAVEKSTVRLFLGNQLVSISGTKDAVTLLKATRIAIADPEHVPAGKYAKAAFLKLGIWKDISSRLVFAPDVRTALLWVERGEADAGIVYESDAKSSISVIVTESFQENPQFPIRYPIAQCLSANKKAKDLYDVLRSPSLVPMFKKLGFQTVNAENEPT